MIILFIIVVLVYLGHTKGSPEPWPQDLCAGRDTLCCGRHLVGERTIISPTSNYFALTKSRVEIALGHLGHIILVKELALVALLTQSSQPMLRKHSIKLQPKRWMIHLAHNSLVSPDMSVRARSSPLTAGSHLKMRLKKKKGFKNSYIKLADCCTGFVHPWEGQRLGPKLLGEGHLRMGNHSKACMCCFICCNLYVKCNVLHGGHQQLHCDLLSATC